MAVCWEPREIFKELVQNDFLSHLTFIFKSSLWDIWIGDNFGLNFFQSFSEWTPISLNQKQKLLEIMHKNLPGMYTATSWIASDLGYTADKFPFSGSYHSFIKNLQFSKLTKIIFLCAWFNLTPFDLRSIIILILWYDVTYLSEKQKTVQTCFHWLEIMYCYELSQILRSLYDLKSQIVSQNQESVTTTFSSSVISSKAITHRWKYRGRKFRFFCRKLHKWLSNMWKRISYKTWDLSLFLLPKWFQK